MSVFIKFFNLLAIAAILVSLPVFIGCGAVSPANSTLPNTTQNNASAPPVTVTVAPSSATLRAGQSQAFVATVTGPANSAVTWLVNGVAGGSSSLGTVTNSGVYTAPTLVPASPISVGAVSSADTSKSAAASVTFTGPPVAVVVTVAPTAITLGAGQSQAFTATVTGAANSGVTWSVDGVAGGNSSLGTVTSSGLYTAPTPVPASPIAITAVSSVDSTKSGSASIAFDSPPVVIAVSVAPGTVSLSAGQSQAFSATVTGTSNSGVNWLVNGVVGGSSSLGTVTSSGVYTAPTPVPGSSVSVAAVSSVDTSKSGTASVSFSGSPGTNYYVASNGSDASDGSQSHPWATIQHAANVAAAGATVHVAPGSYSGSITTRTNGTASGRIRFLSDVQWGAIIRATAVDIVWTNLADYVDIEGFDIAGNDAATCNGIINYASYVRIVGNNVHDVGHDATACLYGAGIVNHQNRAGHDDDVIGNVVHDVGDFSRANSLQHGIYHANLRGHIWNNLVYRSAGWGIHLWHAANQVTIANNTVFNNAYGGMLIGDGDDPGGFPVGVVNDYTVVSNNIVYRNGLAAGASGYGIEEYGATGAHNQYLNNLVYQNGPSDWKLQNGITPVASISADPQFVNYQPDGTGDYHLQAASPAIHTGTSFGLPPLDILGSPRGQILFDLGAYEWNASPGIWPFN